MYRRILVAVDGSRPSNKALAAALKLAKQQRARLRVVHVADVLPPGGMEPAYIDVDTYRDSALTAGRDVIRRAEARARAARVRVESALVETVGHDVSSAVVEQARRWRADLVVLGTHGRTGLARLFMGSVAEGVVRHASAAVLLIRSAGHRRVARRRGR